MREVGRRRDLEELTGEMLCSPDAGRAMIDLARIRFRICDEFGNGLRRKRCANCYHVRKSSDARDRRDIVDEIKIQLLVECRIDGVHGPAEQERVAVGRCTNSRFGCEVACCAGPVLNDDWLAHLLRQPLSEQARNDVEVTTGRKAHDDTHLPGWIGLGACYTRHRQDGAARGQLQEFAAMKFHASLRRYDEPALKPLPLPPRIDKKSKCKTRRRQARNQRLRSRHVRRSNASAPKCNPAACSDVVANFAQSASMHRLLAARPRARRECSRMPSRETPGGFRC